MKFSRTSLPKEGSCFVLLPFGKKTLPDGTVYDWDEHFKKVILKAAKNAGLTATRASDLFSTQPVMELIWKGIQEAEVVIADLTGRNPNVMYELALAHAIWKKVVLVGMDEADLPFDLRTFQYLTYSASGANLVDFLYALEERLRLLRSEENSEATITLLVDSAGPEPIRATVIAVEADYAIVEATDGRKGFLHPDDITWSRTGARLPELGKPLDGAFVRDNRGGVKYSLIAQKENPWPALEREFPVGHTFTGHVMAVTEGTVWVDLNYRISGRIQKNTLHGEAVQQGDVVIAKCKRIDKEKRLADLIFVKKGSQDGHRDDGEHQGARGDDEAESGFAKEPPPAAVGETISATVKVIDAAFILVDIGKVRYGILFPDGMAEALRHDFTAGTLQQGRSIQVQVAEVSKDNSGKWRIRVTEIAD